MLLSIINDMFYHINISFFRCINFHREVAIDECVFISLMFVFIKSPLILLIGDFFKKTEKYFYYFISEFWLYSLNIKFYKKKGIKKRGRHLSHEPL